MTDWYPHITVATIVEDNGRFLLVEEIADGDRVFNQPAGHLEAGETLSEAAIRETLEETGWHIELEAITGQYLYHSAHNDTTYFRTCYLAKALSREASPQLDEGIITAHWLTLPEIIERSDQLRSPMVIRCIEDYLSGQRLPLTMIQHGPLADSDGKKE